MYEFGEGPVHTSDLLQLQSAVQGVHAFASLPAAPLSIRVLLGCFSRTKLGPSPLLGGAHLPQQIGDVTSLTVV